MFDRSKVGYDARSMQRESPGTHPNGGTSRGRAARRLLHAAACLGAMLSAPSEASQQKADELITPAEACGWNCTPSYRETIDYIGALTKRSPLLRLGWFGSSTEGFPLPLVIGAPGRLADPEKARGSGRPVILVLGAIHAGEVDGKDASLLLLREIATGQRAALLDEVILLVAPIYNADGHERVSPHNRMAQDGPVQGQGFRTNGRGLDLNRDFMKMEAPETRALVGNLFRRWRPHVVVDCHVTDGIDFQYVMTHFAGESPNTPPSLAAYLGRMKAAIDRGVRGEGYPSSSFFSLDDLTDPASGQRAWIPTPRFSTPYFEAHNRVSLLAESHAHKPFRERVAATHALLVSILEEAAGDPQALLDAVAKAGAETIRRVQAGESFALTSETTDEPTIVDFEAWEHGVVTSEVTGRPRVVWSRTPVTHRIPFYAKLKPARQVRLPRGYLLGRPWGHLAEKAWLHGLQVERTVEEGLLDVETYRIEGMTWAEKPFQGHHIASASVATRTERRTIPAGSWWIPLDQPSAPVAVFLFEPESPDGLLAWNYFDNLLERKEGVESNVLEAMAAEALADPGVRAAYEAALRADPAMLEDPDRRLWWFYERSPFFDSEVGLYPVFRVTGDLGIRTAPWAPDSALTAP